MFYYAVCYPLKNSPVTWLVSSDLALSQFHSYIIFEQCWVPLTNNILWILWELPAKFQVITFKLQFHTACICVILLTNSYTDFHWEKRCYIKIYIYIYMNTEFRMHCREQELFNPWGCLVVSPVPTLSSCGAHESHPHCRAPGQAQIWHFASHSGVWEAPPRSTQHSPVPGVPQEGSSSHLML